MRNADWLYELTRQHELDLMREAECDRLADSARPTAPPSTHRQLSILLTFLNDMFVTL